MPDHIIKNSEEYVAEMVDAVAQAASQIHMNAKGEAACRKVEADEKCDSTYEKGIRQAFELQNHVLKAKEFMELVNEILTQADQEAAKVNAGQIENT